MADNVFQYYIMLNRLKKTKLFRILKRKNINELRKFLAVRPNHIKNFMKRFYNRSKVMNYIFITIGEVFTINQTKENIIYLIDTLECNKEYYELDTLNNNIAPSYHMSYFNVALNIDNLLAAKYIAEEYKLDIKDLIYYLDCYKVFLKLYPGYKLDSLYNCIDDKLDVIYSMYEGKMNKVAPYKLSHFSNQYEHVVIWYNKKHPFSLVDIRNNLECANGLNPHLLTWENKFKNQMIMYMLRVNSGTNEYKFTEDILFEALVLRRSAEY